MATRTDYHPGTGAGLFRVNAGELNEIWISNEVMSNHYSTSVYHEGHLYGFHGRQEYSPSLRAVELRTGTVNWDIPSYGAGTVTLAGDHLVIVRESGELVVAQVSPEAFTVLATAQVLPSVVRAYPALANGRIYIRNESHQKSVIEQKATNSDEHKQKSAPESRPGVNTLEP